jgi:hypothetical protein
MQASCLQENESQLNEDQLFTSDGIPKANPSGLPIRADHFVRLPFRQATKAVNERELMTTLREPRAFG